MFGRGLLGLGCPELGIARLLHSYWLGRRDKSIQGRARTAPSCFCRQLELDPFLYCLNKKLISQQLKLLEDN